MDKEEKIIYITERISENENLLKLFESLVKTPDEKLETYINIIDTFNKKNL